MKYLRILTLISVISLSMATPAQAIDVTYEFFKYTSANHPANQTIEWKDVRINRAKENVLVMKNRDEAYRSSGMGMRIFGTSSTLTELGFDYLGTCTVNGPLFFVYAQNATFRFNCTDADQTLLPNGFTRLTFADEDAISYGQYSFPGFGVLDTVWQVDLVNTEHPVTVYVDNINVSGYLMTQGQ